MSNFFVFYDKVSKKYYRKIGGFWKKEKKGEVIGYVMLYLI